MARTLRDAVIRFYEAGTKLLFTSVLLIALVLSAAPLPADESVETAGLCRQIEKFINALAHDTRTQCLPSSDHGALSFILISENPIFSAEASKKAWLIVTVGAVANVMRGHTNIKSADVLVSDTNMMKKRRGYKYSIALATRLQQQTKAHQIGLEELYQQLNLALTATAIPRK